MGGNGSFFIWQGLFSDWLADGEKMERGGNVNFFISVRHLSDWLSDGEMTGSPHDFCYHHWLRNIT